MVYLRDNGIDKRLSDHIVSLFVRAPVPAYEKEFMFPCCHEQKIIPKRASALSLDSADKNKSSPNLSAILEKMKKIGPCEWLSIAAGKENK